MTPPNDSDQKKDNFSLSTSIQYNLPKSNSAIGSAPLSPIQHHAVTFASGAAALPQAMHKNSDKSQYALNLSTAQNFLSQAEQAFREKQWQATGQFAQACMAAAPHDETRFQAMCFYAKSLLMMGRTADALPVLLELNVGVPNNANTVVNIGLALIKLKRSSEAIEYLQRTVELTPDDALAYLDLGFALAENGDMAQAKDCYIKAIKLDSMLIEAQLSLSKMLLDEGKIEEARHFCEQVLKLEPNNLRALSQIAFILNSLYPLDMPSQFETVARYRAAIGEKFSSIQTNLQHHTPLRIGFVSADLRAHPVGFFLENTLAELRRDPILSNQLHLIAYSNQEKRDEYTHRIQALFDSWHQVVEWNDQLLVEQIKLDQIDILVDLSGYTAGNRLPVFALKAAPLQISWLGYWGSTGVSTIDYVIADPICVPLGEEQWFFEKIWRLPSLRYCFSMPVEAPKINSLLSKHSQLLVFGCYQQLSKINQGTLHCWTQILKSCPHARLRIQSHGLEKSAVRDIFIERLHNAGIDIQQVDLIGAVARDKYLASYAEVDILLDTFPYPGGTTTAEALWMGVPTITLALPSMLGRQGEALLVNAGLVDWVTYDEEEYVQKAIFWANADSHQHQELANLRSKIREQVRHSPVFNAKQFAQDFVHALYAMWKDKYGQ